MDMSFTKYFLIGPGGLLFLLEFFVPPFKALYPGGFSAEVGRSPFYLPPDAIGAVSVTIHWMQLAIECTGMVLCLAVAYWLLVGLEHLGASD